MDLHTRNCVTGCTNLFSAMMMCCACRRYVPPPTYEELNSGNLEPAPFADLFGDAENIFGQVGLTLSLCMHSHSLLPVHPSTAGEV